MKKSMYILLISSGLIVMIIGEAIAQQCDAILEHGIANIEINKGREASISSAYFNHCEKTDSYYTETNIRSASLSIKGFGASGSRGGGTTKQNILDWCKTNKETAYSNRASYSETQRLYRPAIDAWTTCLKLNQRPEVEIKPTISSRASTVAVSLRYKVVGDGTFELRSVDTKGFTCNPLEFPVKVDRRKVTVQCNRDGEVLREIEGQKYEYLSRGEILIDTEFDTLLLEFPEEFNPPLPLSRAAEIETKIADLQSLLRDSVPVGTIYAYYGDNPPDTFLICNGASVNQAKYRELYEHLKRTNPNLAKQEPGIGEVVYLPDLRGRFLRGLDKEGKVDIDTTERKNADGDIIGAIVGSYQEDAFEMHDHEYTHNAAKGIGSEADGEHPLLHVPVRTSIEGSAETRPKNIAVNFIIKARK